MLETQPIMPEQVPPGDRPKESVPSVGSDPAMAGRMIYRPQETPLDTPESHCTFQPGGQLLMTNAAISQFGLESIMACLFHLQHLANLHNRLGHLQIFEDSESHKQLLFIEDAPGVVTALLPYER